MRLRFKLLCVLLLGFFSARTIGTALADPPPQDNQCSYSEECGGGMCKVWNSDRARYVCEPKQYSVAVWDASCIDKIEAGKEVRIEAPVDNGEPDRKHAVASGFVVKFKQGCSFRYEVRSR